MIQVRKPDEIYTASGQIEHGSFFGRWHFSFGPYLDTDHMQFGRLRVFNDDTLTPGAVWPLHEHREIEVVTYCAAGQFRHADQNGIGGVLQKGWVQHTTVGTGMWHSEINDSPNKTMRFIQMWFIPSQRALNPSVEQKPVEIHNRTNDLYPLVSQTGQDSLKMYSNAAVYSSFLQENKTINTMIDNGRGGYLYVLEGGPIELNGIDVEPLGAAEIVNENRISLTAEGDAELLFIDTAL